MIPTFPRILIHISASAACAALFLIGAVSCSQRTEPPPLIKETVRSGGSAKSDGPAITKNPFPHETGDAVAGRDVYRFETFGQ